MKMRMVISVIVCIVIHTQIIAQPVAGDIAFLGLNSDNPDQFSIILTNYLEDGSVIYFTDAGWTGSGFYANEGHIQWDVPSGGLPGGSIVTFTGGAGGGFTVFGTGVLEAGTTVSAGSLSATASTSSMALSTNGDEILVYTGSVASPTFIACLNFNGAWSWTGVNSSEQTITPPGLTEGTDCILLNDRDNQIIDCSLLPDPASASDYNNSSYWVYNDATRYTLPPAGVPCDLVLPVIITEFSAQSLHHVIVLNWATAAEINTDRFIIERSPDGIVFFEIGTLKAAGYSNEILQYEFLDNAPAAGISYYRLRLTDSDGSYQYTNTIYIRNETGYSPVDIYPNPASEKLLITLDVMYDQEIMFVITHSSGSVVHSETTSVLKGHFIKEFELKYLSDDVYVLKVGSNQTDQSFRFVVNH